MRSAKTSIPKPLLELARMYGVQTSYVDLAKKRRHATPDALTGILRALGAPVDNGHDVADALAERRRDHARHMLEPVYAVTAQSGSDIAISVPVDSLHKRAALEIQFEDGRHARQPVVPAELPIAARRTVDGRDYATLRLPLPGPMEMGYHNLTFDCGSTSHQALLIAAPQKCYEATAISARRWGTFMPLYALRTVDDWGLGDYSALGRLVEWTCGLGGDCVGTLPLLATFLEEPCDFSPYSPVSRRFWNEVFIDVTQSPDWPHCEPARKAAEAVESERNALRKSDFVDYRRVMKLKRACLAELARAADAGNGAFNRYRNDRPETVRYATFRAACEKHGVPWWDWPARPRDGTIGPGDVDADAVRYHCYVQWLADRQLSHIAHGHAASHKLYLDFPLGVHPAGFDTWNDRDLFLRELSAGAPPDAFFVKGQKWGLPPIHPDKLRATAYRYLRESLNHSLTYARILRIDHIMAFHRVFCAPEGAEATDGAYIRYPPAEMYGVLAIESHRCQTEIVGEDLGTVPREVRTAMNRHGVKRMYVLQFSFQDEADEPVAQPPRNALASLNTHDTPTFAAFYTGKDIDDRVSLELLNHDEAAREHERREVLRARLRTFLAQQQSEEGTEAVLHRLLAYLARSRAEIVLVNLEDLWLERAPQNVPGTTTEVPNWRRKARFSFESFSGDGPVRRVLQAVDRDRKAVETT